MAKARVSITPADAWSDQRLTPLQCRLLGLIGAYLGEDNCAWPSQKTLANQLGVSRKAVIDGVKALKTYGYINVVADWRKDGGQTSNKYHVIMDPLSRKGFMAGNPEVTPPSPEGDTPCNLLEVTPPVTPGGDTHRKDPVERPIEECPASEVLERIWSAWSAKGRQRSQSKAKCLEALKRAAKKLPLEQIEAAAILYARKTDHDWHKGLHSWLRDGRYEHFTDQPASQPTTLEDWQAAAKAYCDSRGSIWPSKALGPPPHDPECQAEYRLLKGIARRMEGTPLLAAIQSNLKVREAA